MKEKIQNKWIFYGLIFIVLIIFFNVAHPLIIYNTDDWYSASYMRRPLPIWKDFNPIKVFPEIFMSFTSYIGAFIIYPILGEGLYLRSLSISYALVLCLFILAYIVMFDKYIQKKYDLEKWTSTLVTTLFFVFHFLFFKTNTYNNEYLFSSIDVTCYFHYMIPALLNCSLIMYLLEHNLDDEVRKKGEYEKKGFILLLFYLALFSNLFENAIIAVFIGVNLLFELITYITKKSSFKKYVVDHMGSIGVLVVWFITLFFEVNGVRAGDLSKSGTLNIGKSVNALVNLLKQTNKFFILVAGIVLVTAFVIAVMKKDKEIFGLGIKMGMSAILMLVYIVLLAGKTQASYAGRSDIFLGVAFFLLLLICSALAYVIKHLSVSSVILPILCFVLCIQTINGSKSYRECNGYKLAWEKCLAVGNYFVEQLTEADKNKQTKLELKVPKGAEATKNWPHALYLGDLMGDTLYRHGVISQPIEIEIIPAEELNEEFGLND